MTKKTASFLSPLSFPNSAIIYASSRIEQQKRVLQQVHRVLPPTLAEHARHCVIHGKKLLIYTDTAAWASQLRFYHSAILAAIAPVSRETVSMIQVKIMVESLQASPLPFRKPNIPSAEKIEQLQKQSLAVSDQQLKMSLLKLSATLAKLSDLRGRPG
jgi:hypothetical protein